MRSRSIAARIRRSAWSRCFALSPTSPRPFREIVSHAKHNASMSYDLAVWEGPRPVDDAAASVAFEDLYAEFVGGQSVPPTALIRHYVGELVGRWPDLSPDDDDEDEDASPWSDGPLINNASGPLFYFGMVFSKYQHAAQFAAERARTLGLVCFDPQDGRLVA